MKRKNKLVYFWAVVLTIVMTTASASVITATNEDFEKNVNVVKKEITPISESMEITETKNLLGNTILPTDIPFTDLPEDEYSPDIAMGIDETLLLAYTYREDLFTSDVPWSFSTDNGQTWSNPVGWNIEGGEENPSVAYRAGMKFIGSWRALYSTLHSQDKTNLGPDYWRYMGSRS